MKACIHTGKEAARPSSSNRMKSPPQQSGEGAGTSAVTQWTPSSLSAGKHLPKRSRGTEPIHAGRRGAGAQAGRAAGRVRTTRCGEPRLPARLPRVLEGAASRAAHSQHSGAQTLRVRQMRSKMSCTGRTRAPELGAGEDQQGDQCGVPSVVLRLLLTPSLT